MGNLTNAYKKFKKAEDTFELSKFENDISEEYSKSLRPVKIYSNCINTVRKKKYDEGKC